MATVSKTKDSGEGWWWWMDGGDYSGVLHQLLSAGWPCLSKKKGETEGKREKHLTQHIEKKRALNAIKARGEISH